VASACVVGYARDCRNLEARSGVENALAAQQAIDEALWPSLQKASPIARRRLARNGGVRLALDTNRYSDLCRGDEFVLELVETSMSMATFHRRW